VMSKVGDLLLGLLVDTHPANISSKEKHALATRGQKLRENEPPCAMCELPFTFERPGCHDYAGRHVHTWCEVREPSPERKAAIAAVSDALGQCPVVF
jgi:hypothetical protein